MKLVYEEETETIVDNVVLRQGKNETERYAYLIDTIAIYIDYFVDLNPELWN